MSMCGPCPIPMPGHGAIALHKDELDPFPGPMLLIIAGKFQNDVALVLVRKKFNEFLSGVPAGSDEDDRHADHPDAQEGEDEFGGDGAHGVIPS
jgi:hypothetical protein